MSEVIGIPEEEWTAGQREFVGSEFETADGGTLTVIGVDNGKTTKGWWNQRFILECSICSKDKELWRYGSIKSTKFYLLQGNSPCGCGRSFRYTESQNLVRAKRAAENSNYTFTGRKGDYKGGKTIIPLVCNVTNQEKIVTLDYLMKRPHIPRVGRSGNYKEIPDHISSFLSTGKFKEGTQFIKAEDEWWYVFCPVCSQDTYVKEGLCTGTFKARRGSLLKGVNSCRCNWNSLTEEQQIFRMTNILNNRGSRFLGFVEKYNGSYTRSKYMCLEGKHENIQTVETLLQNTPCTECHKDRIRESGAFNGYFPLAVEKEDNLYVIRLKGEYLKVGRAFVLDNRFYKHTGNIVKSANIQKSELELLSVYSAKHQEVYEAEQWVHAELRERGFQYEKETWNTELFELGCEDLIEYLLSKSGLKKIQ